MTQELIDEGAQLVTRGISQLIVQPCYTHATIRRHLKTDLFHQFFLSDSSFLQLNCTVTS